MSVLLQGLSIGSFCIRKQKKSPDGLYLLPLFHNVAAVRSFTASSGVTRDASHKSPSITCSFWSKADPLTPTLSFLHCFADVCNTITTAGCNERKIISHEVPSLPQFFHLDKACSFIPSSSFHTGHGKFSVIGHTERPTLCHTQPWPQSTAHQSHQTPTDQRRVVGSGYNQLGKAIQR